MKRLGLAIMALAALTGFVGRALALPTMIRLGYTNCAACHIAPQGGGLLNSYGRGIDEAQSLRGGEYQPTDIGVIRALSWGGRITQDFRFLGQEQLSTGTNQPTLGLNRSRFMYRSATELGGGFRFTATVLSENQSAPRPNLKYDAGVRPTEVYVTTALISYRATKNLEFSAGRDQLPSGINVPDLTMYVRSRNGMGYYDAPTQVKAIWWGKHYQINPYAFAPGGFERSGFHESGAGALAEYDVLGHGKTVVGVNALRGFSRNVDRTMVGPYVRLGFGKWGILAEHDITDRTLKTTASPTGFRQHATVAQLFWYPKEWLAFTGGAERLSVQRPYSERLVTPVFGISARLSPQFTVGFTTRYQHNVLNGRNAPVLAVQLAMKTPN